MGAHPGLARSQNHTDVSCEPVGRLAAAVSGAQSPPVSGYQSIEGDTCSAITSHGAVRGRHAAELPERAGFAASRSASSGLRIFGAAFPWLGVRGEGRQRGECTQREDPAPTDTIDVIDIVVGQRQRIGLTAKPECPANARVPVDVHKRQFSSVGCTDLDRIDPN
jgi:hypothetical protein